MSDISVLSGRYDAISKFSTKLNEAILLLKKAALRANQPRKMTVVSDWTETDRAREFLGELLGEIIETLEGRPPAKSTIPHSLVDDFQKLRVNEPGLDQVLKNLHLRLTSFRDLIPEDFEFLDKLLSVVDADVSAVFSKLWRKR
jgi:hypothetical protein